NNIINLKVIRFWDEIFPDNKEWVEEFTERYKREINLPFEIWIHPLKISYDLIKKLVDAGLYKAVMGIQSGSPRIRKEIFGRYELQEDIINASKILSDCRVPRVIYDFILRHPFETEEDIIKSFELCMKLHPPFELQLHALNFFPGTDIVEKAIKLNVIDRNELEKIMYAPIKEQYKAYWGVNDNDIMINFWYSLIYMTQFKTIRPLISFLSKHVQSLNKKFTFLIELSIKLQKYLVPIARMKDYYKKIYLILRIGY
ncbi:MAG: radical SAM protein, partial [Firmicutes bacterium]|nr:radical SAM protein [Bacillota bacterium]